MTAVFTARRRAEEFDELIERASAADLADTRYAELAGVLATLRHAPPVRPRPEFSLDLRARLMLAAETALTPDTATQARARRPAPRRRARDRRIAAALGGFAIVSAGTSMAVAAQTSLPGDTLYPLKRALENAHAGVQSGDGKGTTLLANASGRLQEVGELSRAGSEDPETIARTLQAFTDQANEASSVLLSTYQADGQVASLQQLRTFTADSMTELRYLQTLVPVEARASLIAASDALAAIDQQALDACPGCSAVSTMPTAAATGILPAILDPVLTPAEKQPASTPRKHPHHDKTPTTTHQDDARSKKPSSPPPSDPGPASSGPDADPLGTHHTGGSGHDGAGGTADQPGGSADPLAPLKHVLKHPGIGVVSDGVGGLLDGADQVVPGVVDGIIDPTP